MSEPKERRVVKSLGRKRQQLDDVEVVRVTAQIPEEVGRWLEVYAVKKNQSLSLALTDLIKAFMQSEAEEDDAG